jgi:hypothetical protein
MKSVNRRIAFLVFGADLRSGKEENRLQAVFRNNATARGGAQVEVTK